MQGTAMVRRVQTLGREQTSERRSLGEAHLAEVAQLEATVGKMREELAAKQHADARALLAKQHQALGMPLPRARDHPRSPEIARDRRSTGSSSRTGRQRRRADEPAAARPRVLQCKPGHCESVM